MSEKSRKDKGEKAEKIVERACKELVSENRLRYFQRNDISGQDFILFLPDDQKVVVEVKSSCTGEFLHKLEHNNPVIVVPIKKIAGLKKRKINKLVSKTKNKIKDLIAQSSL